MNFKVGDVVILKSGGPKMTIMKDYQSGWFLTYWFSENKIISGEFDGNALFRVYEKDEDVGIDIHK